MCLHSLILVPNLVLAANWRKDGGALLVAARAEPLLTLTNLDTQMVIHLEKFWRISLHLTDDAIAKLYLT